MRHAAVFSQVDIPRIRFGIETVLGEVFEQNVEPFFTLTAADDFADAGDEHIHGSDGFLIIVETHVKRFDFFWIVIDGDGFFKMLFGQPAFVFGLEVEAVGDWIFKGLAAGNQQLDGSGVGDSFERTAGNKLESLAANTAAENFDEWYQFVSTSSNEIVGCRKVHFTTKDIPQTIPVSSMTSCTG